MLSGTVPVKLLERRSSFFRLDRLTKLTLVSSPLNWFALRSIVTRFVQLPRAAGSSPDMLLCSKCSSSNLFRSPIDSGILPLSSFPPRSRVTRFVSLVMPLSAPSNQLLGKERCSNDVTLKTSSGRVPLRLL